MNTVISFLTVNEVKDFWPVFAEVLGSQFPGYTPKVINYFLEKNYTPANFFYWLENKAKTIFVARDNQNIVGFAVVDAPYGGVSFCRWLGVKKDYQRKGIGTKLINAWLALAKSLGCHKAEIAAQPQAKGFYEKIGLTLEGFRRLSYFGIDQYIFGRVIGEPKDEIIIKY